MDHVIVHAYRIVAIDVAFFHLHDSIKWKTRIQAKILDAYKKENKKQMDVSLHQEDVFTTHHLIDRTKNLKNSSCIPRQAMNRILQFGTVEFPVLVNIEMLPCTTDDEFSRGAIRVLFHWLRCIGICALSFPRGTRFIGSDQSR